MIIETLFKENRQNNVPSSLAYHPYEHETSGGRKHLSRARYAIRSRRLDAGDIGTVEIS